MSRLLTVAATQMACEWNISRNVDRAEKLIREAAGQDAQIILIQELFETPYFCIEQNHKHLELATTIEDNSTIKRFCALARDLEVVLPVSWFEKAGKAFFNSVAMGQKVKEANRTDQRVLVHSFDLDAIAFFRERWCLYRDRRPEYYSPIMTLDGRV